MENDKKIVNFFKYCPKCKYIKNTEDIDPCHDCLSTPVNTNSHKPVYFDENPYYKPESEERNQSNETDN